MRRVGQQSELRATAATLAADIAKAGSGSVAVVDFTDLQGNPRQLGRYLAEEFEIGLLKGLDSSTVTTSPPSLKNTSSPAAA
jgi:hypothetical protein